jgi:hypothetical protein
MDMNHFYKSLKSTQNPDGLERVDALKYTEEEAKKYKYFYIYFSATTDNGRQTASSDGKKSSYYEPSFTALTPYLGSTVSINNTSNSIICLFKTIGTLTKDESTGNYYIKNRIQIFLIFLSHMLKNDY